MTKEELIRELEKCAELGPEEGHIEADALLVAFIGDPDVGAAFRKLSKWYS